MTVVNPKSISGINSITMASGSDNLLTIHANDTSEKVRVNNSGDVIVGSGVTLSADGHSFHTGVVTATSFSGTVASSNLSGALPALDGSALTGIAATDNVRTGILDVAGVGTFRGDVNIPDKIIHLGDTNTAIRFPSADTVTAETGGSERFRITSAGRIGINETSPNATLHIKSPDAGNNRLELVHENDAANEQNQITFKNNTTQTAYIVSGKDSSNNNLGLSFGTGSTERIRIASNGDLLYGSSDRNYACWYKSPTNSSSNAATSSTEVLTFGTAVIANTDVYNTSNGRYTAPVDGLYHIRCNGLVDNNASAGGKQLLMYKNGSVYGSQIAYNTRLDADSTSRYQLLSGTGIMYMSASDYAQIYASDGMHVSNETNLIVYLIRGTFS